MTQVKSKTTNGKTANKSKPVSKALSKAVHLSKDSTLVRSSKRDKTDEEEQNMLASKELLRVLTEVRNGNFSVRMPIDEIGLNGKIYSLINIYNKTLRLYYS